MDPIRVVVAADHELTHYALRSVLEAQDDVTLVGETHEGSLAVALCEDVLPDVLVMDLRVSGVSHAEVCERVRERSPATKVLIVADGGQDPDPLTALDAGACGILLSDANPEHIVHAVRAVADGQTVLDHEAVERVTSSSPHAVARDAPPLSAREAEVLALMAKGLSNHEIGRALWIGETTVKTHVSHILRKLGKADRTQAVIEAVRLGMVDLDR